MTGADDRYLLSDLGGNVCILSIVILLVVLTEVGGLILAAGLVLGRGVMSRYSSAMQR